MFTCPYPSVLVQIFKSARWLSLGVHVAFTGRSRRKRGKGENDIGECPIDGSRLRLLTVKASSILRLQCEKNPVWVCLRGRVDTTKMVDIHCILYSRIHFWWDVCNPFLCLKYL